MSDPFAIFRLDGRVAVVTGAASGIGRGAAKALAAFGARVVMSDIDAAGLDAARADIPGAAQVAGDAADIELLEALADRAEALGPIAIWVNAAGVGALQPVHDATREVYRRITRINQDGVYWGCAVAARRMVPHRRGSIINISSAASVQTQAGLSAYAMTKAAVNQLTRTLALELGSSGIRVNAIAPGFIETALTVPAHLPAAERDAVIAGNAARAPLLRTGLPADVAHGLVYLASDAAAYVTGQVLHINGGTVMA